jgi:hypothetical protein
VDEALAHPYLASLHSPEDEATCPLPFDFRYVRSARGTRERLTEPLAAATAVVLPNIMTTSPIL